MNAMDFIVAGIESRKLRYLLAEHGAVAFDIAKQELIDLREIANRCGPPERAARYAQLGPIRDAISWYNEEGESQISALFEHPLPALPKTANLTLRIPDGIPPREVIAAIERALIANDQVDSEGFVYHFGEFYVDVVSEVSKGDGALLLLEELGASPRKALAVGDGDNDISMFQVLGSCFCPANAAAELKRVCRRRSGVLSSLHCGEATLEFYLELGGPMS